MSKVTRSYIHKFKKNEEASLPILAFYPVDRGVKATPVEVSENFINNQFTAYDDALEKTVNFDSFFLGFVNEKISKTKKRLNLEVSVKTTQTY